MGPLLVVILVLPAAVGVLAWWAPPRVGAVATVGAGAATFACALALVPAAGSGVVTALDGQLRADALSVVFLVATAFLYATTAVFAVGYLRHPAPSRYRRRFWAGFNLFCWAMAVAPIVANLVLLWVAIEITTVVSALLVAIDDTDGAAEASWKYLLIASMGLGVALFATVVLYAAGTVPLGPGHAMVLPTLLGAAHRLPPTMVRLAYVLAVLGFGTKMGLAPVHTWLPDAHAEAPTPVSALLSGSLLAISFYAILRYYQVTAAVLGPTFPREVLLGFGLASLALAALYL
ncbi:MAG TPA: proton-conducting transporter membrane subunit, partial [Acidimicrobiales bacterium]|nr:proton-conducting transporter membrane subunit [Acidimicrobiales bacterium]